MNKLAREAREMAEKTGKLPHEILLDLARGKSVLQEFPDPQTGELKKRVLTPDLEMIKDAAKAAAPYFAPKISTVEVIQGVSDDELDRLIALAAAEAGVSLSAGGEVPQGEAATSTGAAPDSSSRRSRIRVH